MKIREQNINEHGDIREYEHFEDGTWDGEYKEYYNDNTLKLVGIYKNNRQEGIFKEYNRNNELITESFYFEGVKKNEVRYDYYLNGTKKEKRIEEGGKFKEKENYYETGELEYRIDQFKSENFSKDGYVIIRVTFSKDPKKSKIEYPHLLKSIKNIDFKEDAIKLLCSNINEVEEVTTYVKKIIDKYNFNNLKVKSDTVNKLLLWIYSK